MQGGAVVISGTGSKGTFENCNFTSNSAVLDGVQGGVSLVVVSFDIEDSDDVDYNSLSVYCDCFL